MTIKSDIWSLGIILYQWVYNEYHPYIAIARGGDLGLGELGALDLPIILKPVPDSSLWETMRLCLEKRPKLRGNINDLLMHPYLNPTIIYE